MEMFRISIKNKFDILCYSYRKKFYNYMELFNKEIYILVKF